MGGVLTTLTLGKDKRKSCHSGTKKVFGMQTMVGRVCLTATISASMEKVITNSDFETDSPKDSLELVRLKFSL